MNSGASMRPRRNGRGNTQTFKQLRLLVLASMRPRRNGRGNPGKCLFCKGAEESFNEAAAQWPRKWLSLLAARRLGNRFNEAAAQWPRKSRKYVGTSALRSSFNEAAAQWPRK